MSFKVRNNTIFLTRGDTFKAHLTINYPDGSVYTPKVGDSIRFALKENIEDKECLIFREIPIDTMLLVLYPGDTKELEFGNYVYDIQLTKANGWVTTIVETSEFELKTEVTYND